MIHSDYPILPVTFFPIAQYQNNIGAQVLGRWHAGDFTTLNIYAKSVLKSYTSTGVTDLHNAFYSKNVVNVNQSITNHDTVPPRNATFGDPANPPPPALYYPVFRKAFRFGASLGEQNPTTWWIKPTEVIAHLPIVAPWVDIWINSEVAMTNVAGMWLGVWASNAPMESPMGWLGGYGTFDNAALTYDNEVTLTDGGMGDWFEGLVIPATTKFFAEFPVQTIGQAMFHYECSDQTIRDFDGKIEVAVGAQTYGADASNMQFNPIWRSNGNWQDSAVIPMNGNSLGFYINNKTVGPLTFYPNLMPMV